MDSAAKESILSKRLSKRLGGLILKDEQKLAVEALMSENLSFTRASLSRYCAPVKKLTLSLEKQ